MNEWIKCCDTGNVFEIILPLNLNLISIYIKEITFFRIIWCCPLKRGIWIGPGSIGEEKQSKIGLRIEAKYIESIENWFPSSAGEVLAEVWLVDCLLGARVSKCEGSANSSQLQMSSHAREREELWGRKLKPNHRRWKVIKASLAECAPSVCQSQLPKGSEKEKQLLLGGFSRGSRLMRWTRNRNCDLEKTEIRDSESKWHFV